MQLLPGQGIWPARPAVLRQARTYARATARGGISCYRSRNCYTSSGRDYGSVHHGRRAGGCRSRCSDHQYSGGGCCDHLRGGGGRRNDDCGGFGRRRDCRCCCNDRGGLASEALSQFSPMCHSILTFSSVHCIDHRINPCILCFTLSYLTDAEADTNHHYSIVTCGPVPDLRHLRRIFMHLTSILPPSFDPRFLRKSSEATCQSSLRNCACRPTGSVRRLVPSTPPMALRGPARGEAEPRRPSFFLHHDVLPLDVFEAHNQPQCVGSGIDDRALGAPSAGCLPLSTDIETDMSFDFDH